MLRLSLYWVTALLRLTHDELVTNLQRTADLHNTAEIVQRP